MPVASLSNFTVPLASDQSATTQGMLFPKLNEYERLPLVNVILYKSLLSLSPSKVPKYIPALAYGAYG